MIRKCEACGSPMKPREECPSCTLYSAAVAAGNAAASSLARAFDWRAERAWINEHGVFAWVNDRTVHVAGPEVADPFVRLAGEARKMQFPTGSCWAEAKKSTERAERWAKEGGEA